MGQTQPKVSTHLSDPSRHQKVDPLYNAPTNIPLKAIRPRLWSWLWRVLVDWGVIVACFVGARWLSHPIGWLAAVLVIGTRQHALGIMGHDAVHRLICRNRRLNDALGNFFCLWPVGISLGGYRRFHFNHHRNVGTADDPELIHKKGLPQWELPLTRRSLITQLLFDFLGGSFPHTIMGMYLNKPVSIMGALGPPFWLLSVVAISWYYNALWIPLLWLASLATSFWACFRMRIWTEHIGTDSSQLIEANWWQKLIFLPHNTWYHWEHHEYASVPCWALPLVREPNAPVRSVAKMFEEFRTNNISELPLRKS